MAFDAADRQLEPIGRGISRTPFHYQGNQLGTLREDQVPRYLGALTDPDKLQTRTMALADLQATQNRVQTSKVKAIAADPPDDDAGRLPVVIRHNGRDLIADGHHRLAAAWLNGADNAKVAFKDIQPVTQVLKDAPSAGDVHVNGPNWATRGGKKKPEDGFDDNDEDADKAIATVLKVDQSLGLVFGWAIVCKQDGQPYVDLQGDHIPEAAMLPAACDFMENSRIAKEMHEGGPAGSVVFAFPMTTDIAKSLGITTPTTGLLIAMKPSDPAILAKFASGEFTGFSIGGETL